MNAAATIRENAARLEQQARELRALADALDGAEPTVAPVTAPAPATIGVSAATKILRVSESSAYRYARRFGLAWRTHSGAWAFDRDKVRAFAAAKRDGIDGAMTDLKGANIFTNPHEGRICSTDEARDSRR